MSLSESVLQSEIAAVEAEWARLDRQGDRSAAVKSEALVERLYELRAALRRAEQESEDTDEAIV